MGLYGEFFRPLGVEDQLTVTLGDHVEGRRAEISVDRGHGGFTDHERRLMERLRPHLTAARDNAVQFSLALARAPLAGPDDARPVPLERLTDRGRDVLARVASGHTNAQIARTLDISAGTVRKHLEHVLSRLGVPSRTAAAVCYITGSAPRQAPSWTAVLSSVTGLPRQAFGRQHCYGIRVLGDAEPQGTSLPRVGTRGVR